MESPYIIAEIGSNFGNLNDCIQCISYAKSSGADAVKFQLYDFKSLYGFSNHASVDPYLRDQINRSSIKEEWLPKLHEKARACDIEFGVSVFSPHMVNVVDPFVDFHKIASSEMNHVQLLDAIDSKEMRTFMSVGASVKAEIDFALLEMDMLDDITLLYCNVAYPANETDLYKINTLRYMYHGFDVGFSDHSTDYTTIPVLACLEFGAKVLEKHFNPLELIGTPDAKHSINSDQFKVMVDLIRDRPERTKHPLLVPLREENDAILKHKRRLIAIKEIEKGDVLTLDGNYGIYRSLESDVIGLSPQYAYDLNSKISDRDFSVGDGIWIESD